MKHIFNYTTILFTFLYALIIMGFCLKAKHIENIEGTYMNLNNDTDKKDSTIKTPVLTLTGDHTSEEQNPLLTKLSIDVKVIGNIATTTLDMTFMNKNNRVMEGELIFPLGEGQTVSRLALEVNSILREAVVVDKNKGQQVYEELIRQKVDPGLVEQVQGNSYRARIYPLPANGTKRMIIAYEEELTTNDKLLQYYLPLDYKDTLSDFSLHIEVAQQKVVKNSDGILVEYKNEGDKTLADIHEKNFNPDKFLAFSIEKPSSPKAYIEESGATKYFYAPVKIESENRPKKLPSTLALFWDASGSGASQDISGEIELLKNYFSKMNSLQLTVITFANTILEEKKITITPSNFNELENYLKNINYDGATQLSILDFNKYNADEIILVSDGLSNFGEDKLQNSKAPVITLTASKQNDYDLLKYLSQSTGGNFINLSTLSKEEALSQLLNEPLQIISFSYGNENSSKEVMETYPTTHTLINGGVALSGIANSVNSDFTLNYGYGNEVTGTIKIPINPSKATNYNSLIKRIWAQKKLQYLLLQKEKNKAEIINCAIENKIVTPFTSLLVLDRLEDYVKYKITPPEELQKSYDSAIKNEKVVEEKTKKTQIEKVKKLFDERKSWWAKDFSAAQTINNKKDTLNESNLGYGYSDGRGASEQTEVRGHSTSTRNRYMARAASPSFNSNSNNDAASAGSYEDNVRRISGQKNMEQENNKTINSTLTTWEPNKPYLSTIKKAVSDKRYTTYLTLKKTYGTSPSFYLDIANYFIQEKQNKEGIRILSNLAEIELKNYRLLRVLAHALEEQGNINDAIILYKEVMELRKEEPQSYRDLGLALSKNNQAQEAIEMLYKVIEKNWDNRFPEIEVIVLGEINNIISNSSQKLNTSFMDAGLISPMPMEARVILNWDADNCDIDLWVTDPKGEKCFYGNRNTKIGGRNSADLTQGYGPEEFIIKKAMKGKYKVEINYYGTREQTLLGPTTIQVEMYTNYGKQNVTLKQVTRRLEAKKETLEIGTFTVE